MKLTNTPSDNLRVLQQPKLREFKVYDFNYYQNDLPMFEKWYLGELNIATIVVRRSFVEVDHSDMPKAGVQAQWGEKHFMYHSLIEDSRFQEE